MRLEPPILQRFFVLAAVLAGAAAWADQDFPKPYSPPCVERENVFEFAEKPSVKLVAKDRYAITFAVKGACDVTVAVVDPDSKKELVEGRGVVVRHLASGVLGGNAPAPFQKNSLKQTIYWDGKNDLGVYVKEPETLKVRVMLGLKPEFDKRLGGTSPYNLPGRVNGIAADEGGVYVFSAGIWKRSNVRKFDHDGKYLKTLVPPPANLPEEKLAGQGYVEYEPGVKAPQGRNIYDTVSNYGRWLPINAKTKIEGGKGFIFNTEPQFHRPAAADGRLYYCSATLGNPPAHLHYIYTDGSTDIYGANGCSLGLWGGKSSTMLAASPDGRWLYMVFSDGKTGSVNAVARCLANATSPGMSFVGRCRAAKDGRGIHYMKTEPGSGPGELNNPVDVACDAAGRVYVADQLNNRISIFDAEGKPVKTIAVDRPVAVQVHRRTGAVYVLHAARVKGKSSLRIAKYASLDAAEPAVCSGPLPDYNLMTLDSWSAKPRLWLSGEWRFVSLAGSSSLSADTSRGLAVWEEDENSFRKVLDFREKARKDDGEFYAGRCWTAHFTNKVVCDPVRERVYFCIDKGFRQATVFDLTSGKPLGIARFPGSMDDVAFDKRGYLHGHFNPMYQNGVGRLDPDQSQVVAVSLPNDDSGLPVWRFKETPYDYGVEDAKKQWLGIIPVKDQGGAKAFQDGLGVNMRGDIAEQCNIFYVPKMDDLTREFTMAGAESLNESVGYKDLSGVYSSFLRGIQDAQKRGEEVYSIRRRPGVPLNGATVWTFERSGELRRECAVTAGGLINGVQMDEDGALYFVNGRVRMYGEHQFLWRRGGTFGAPDDTSNLYPVTGTLIKTRPKTECLILQARSPVPMDEIPNRPPDLLGLAFIEEQYMNRGNWWWAEGAEWLYAGASPLLIARGCTCPTMRFCTDWYKRTFVPEAYRHSIGVVDTAGNLILHVGRYGNIDSADGAKSRIPVGGDNLATAFNEMVSATDNYLCFEDNGERLTAARIAYHAEETVPIQTK